MSLPSYMFWTAVLAMRYGHRGVIYTADAMLHIKDRVGLVCFCSRRHHSWVFSVYQGSSGNGEPPGVSPGWISSNRRHWDGVSMELCENWLPIDESGVGGVGSGLWSFVGSLF